MWTISNISKNYFFSICSFHTPIQVMSQYAAEAALYNNINYYSMKQHETSHSPWYSMIFKQCLKHILDKKNMHFYLKYLSEILKIKAHIQKPALSESRTLILYIFFKPLDPPWESDSLLNSVSVDVARFDRPRTTWVNYYCYSKTSVMKQN